MNGIWAALVEEDCQPSWSMPAFFGLDWKPAEPNSWPKHDSHMWWGGMQHDDHLASESQKEHTNKMNSHWFHLWQPFHQDHKAVTSATHWMTTWTCHSFNHIWIHAVLSVNIKRHSLLDSDTQWHQPQQLCSHALMWDSCGRSGTNKMVGTGPCQQAIMNSTWNISFAPNRIKLWFCFIVAVWSTMHQKEELDVHVGWF